MTTPSRDIRDAINLANGALGQQAGTQVQVTRAVLNALIGAANESIARQQSAGSHP